MVVVHKNMLSTYLSDWTYSIRHIAKSRNPTAPTSGSKKIFGAVANNVRDINTLLRLLDQRIKVLESRPMPTIDNFKDLDFTADVEAVVFLKACYLFIRIYLDGISSVIHYFYRSLNLPKSFNKLLKKLDSANLPSDLSAVLAPAKIWFRPFKERRDALVHHYEDFLILYVRDEGNKNIDHASLFNIENNRALNYGAIRSYLGEFLRDCQILVDNLLDHFDQKFYEWYGIVQSSNSRNRTIFEDGCPMLFWAHKYGGYSHPDLQIRENGPFETKSESP